MKNTFLNSVETTNLTRVVVVVVVVVIVVEEGNYRINTQRLKANQIAFLFVLLWCKALETNQILHKDILLNGLESFV